MELMIHVNSEEKEQIERFAKSKGKSVSEVFLSAIMEQIADEMDIVNADEAWADYQKFGVGYSLKESAERLGVEL